MVDFNVTEPEEVRLARGKFDHTMYIRARDIEHMISQSGSQLLYVEISDRVRGERESQLLYGFCDAMSCYCELMDELNKERETIPDVTHHFMEVSTNKFKEVADKGLYYIDKMQEQFNLQGKWYPDYVQFGNWLLKGDTSVDPMRLAENALKSVNEAMETIRSIENAARNGEEIDEQQFGEACQKLGEGKTMIENCLYPAFKMIGEEKACDILKVAKGGFIDSFIQEHNLESHLTPRGHSLEYSSLDKGRNSYLPKFVKNFKVLTDRVHGLKLVQKESHISTKGQIKIPFKDKSLTATFAYDKGINRQYNPNSSEFMQKMTQAVTALGSALDVIGDIVSLTKPQGVAGFVKNNASITIDPNERVKGDEKKFNPHSIIDKLADKPEMELNADGTENIEKYKNDLNQEHISMVIELAKMTLNSANIEIGEKELNDYMDKLDKLAKVIDTGELYKLDQLQLDNVIGAVNACADLVCEYSDISKLKKLDIEVKKTSSFAREAIRNVREVAEKTYWKELAKEQAWERDNPSYVENKQRNIDHLKSKGLYKEGSAKYEPISHEHDTKVHER